MQSPSVHRVRKCGLLSQVQVKRYAALDLETYAIEPGLLTPKLVCGSSAEIVDGVVVGTLLARGPALSRAHELLASDVIIVGANIAYDFGVLVKEDPKLLPLIFKAYDEERVFDVQIAQALNAIYEGNLYLDPRTGEPIRNPETKRRGRYSLQFCVELVLGRINAKANDRWRTSYALLDGIPQEDWPDDARQYPVDDAVNTLETALTQINGGGKGCTPGPHKNIEDMPTQAAAAWALQLGAIWGFRTDGERVAALRKRSDEAHVAFVNQFQKLGWFRDNGTLDSARVKHAVAVAYGNGQPCHACVKGKVLSHKTGNPINCKECSGTGLDVMGVPLTDKGAVSAKRDTLVESGDEYLEALGESEAEKVRTTYLPFLETGVTKPITLRPNILLSSGRISYDGPIQLLPRGVKKGDIAGEVRPCFRARPGYVYLSVDYSALELCTFAQVCLWILGYSHMADTINATGDPGAMHSTFAAKLAGCSVEEMVTRLAAKDENAKMYRQASKPSNYGFLGGMGTAKFILTQRQRNAGTTKAPDGLEYNGIRFCLLIPGPDGTRKHRCGEEKVTEWKGRATPPICKACAVVVEEFIRPQWFKTWPEVRPYFGWVTSRTEAGLTMPCLGTYRERGGCGFTDGANNSFQALGADGAKRAYYNLVKECYTDRESPLWGTRPIVLAHDEAFAETPEETAHLAGPRMSTVMVDGLRELVRDVAVKADPALCYWWYKGMETVYKDGKLIPWDPN